MCVGGRVPQKSRRDASPSAASWRSLERFPQQIGEPTSQFSDSFEEKETAQWSTTLLCTNWACLCFFGCCIGKKKKKSWIIHEKACVCTADGVRGATFSQLFVSLIITFSTICPFKRKSLPLYPNISSPRLDFRRGGRVAESEVGWLSSTVFSQLTQKQVLKLLSSTASWMLLRIQRTLSRLSDSLPAAEQYSLWSTEARRASNRAALYVSSSHQTR